MSNSEQNPYYDTDVPAPQYEGQPLIEGIPPAQEASRPQPGQEDTTAGQVGEVLAQGGAIEVQYTSGESQTSAEPAAASQEQTPAFRPPSHRSFIWGGGRTPRTDREGTSPGRGHTPPSGKWPNTGE